VGKVRDRSVPNTRKKLNRVREARQRDQQAAEKAARASTKALGRLGYGFDEATRGCKDV
jgi:hypothetical protein